MLMHYKKCFFRTKIMKAHLIQFSWRSWSFSFITKNCFPKMPNAFGPFESTTRFWRMIVLVSKSCFSTIDLNWFLSVFALLKSHCMDNSKCMRNVITSKSTDDSIFGIIQISTCLPKIGKTKRSKYPNNHIHYMNYNFTYIKMRQQPEFPLPQLIPLQIFDSDNKASIIRYLVSQTVLIRPNL